MTSLWHLLFVGCVMWLIGFAGAVVTQRANDASMARDAARYRYLRRSWRYGGPCQHRLEWYLPRTRRRWALENQLDAAIDDARSRS